MTENEKAKELVQHFKGRGMDGNENYAAKECALIVVDEVLKELSPLDYHPLGSYPNPKIEYWQKVIQEIKKS